MVRVSEHDLAMVNFLVDFFPINRLIHDDSAKVGGLSILIPGVWRRPNHIRGDDRAAFLFIRLRRLTGLNLLLLNIWC